MKRSSVANIYHAFVAAVTTNGATSENIENICTYRYVLILEIIEGVFSFIIQPKLLGFGKTETMVSFNH